jgi:hypothetical protein
MSIKCYLENCEKERYGSALRCRKHQILQEVRWFIVGPIVVLPLALALLVFGGYRAAEISCENVGIETNRETSFRFFGGCFIETSEGLVVPQDQWARFELETP